MKRALLTILFLGFASVGYADVGERFFSITCGASSLTVEPFIAWNEEAAKYSEAQRKGRSKDGYTTIFYFSKRYDEAVQTSCTVGGRAFQIAVLQGKLEIIENKKVLMRKIIDDVWDFYGPVYRVQYIRDTWSEYCGHVERNPSWRAARFEEKDTNCR